LSTPQTANVDLRCSADAWTRNSSGRVVTGAVPLDATKVANVEPRVSFITLVVRNLPLSRVFYVDGLGWPVEFEAPGEVLMIRVGDKLVLSLWDEASATTEIGPVTRGEGVPPVTLAHNVGTKVEVDMVVAEAKTAGAAIVAEPKAREWGGYSGYFADPDGFRWEVAWNPGPVGQSVL